MLKDKIKIKIQSGKKKKLESTYQTRGLDYETNIIL
jgi:hypothetical protein